MDIEKEQQVDKFLMTLSPLWDVRFRSIDTDGVAQEIDREDAYNITYKNIYFLWWVRPGAEQLRDIDIQYINYIRLDIDIKKQATKALWVEPTKDEILEFIDEIKKILNVNIFFKEWRYLVYSWGWLHIYYTNDSWIELWKDMTHDIFSYAMKRLYKKYNTIVDNPIFEADMAVSNAARIMRLPGSINQKNDQECAILYEQEEEASIFSHIKSLWVAEKTEREEELRKQKVDIDELKHKILEHSSYSNELYEVINKIPAYLIAQLLLPEFKYDGKKNFLSPWKWYTWYYYFEATNSICNGWSRYFDWGTEVSCWNNYSLVKNFLELENREVFEWFKKIFKL